MRNKRNSSRPKVNIKARINRHLRIGRETGIKSTRGINYSIVFVLSFLILLFPIYPGLANAFYKNTEVDFYRGDVDRNSIVNSYEYSDIDGGEGAGYLDQNVEAFVSVDTILTNARDTSGSKEIVDYKVKKGESFQSIADDFGISINSILWANDFQKGHVLQPSDTIKVPPVSGLVYKVEKGDNLVAIANKYEIGLSAIEKQNDIRSDDTLRVGQILILPGAKKIIVKPKPVEEEKKVVTTKTTKKKKTTTRTNSDRSYSPPKETAGSSSRYKLRVKGGYNRFYPGNCTWFVRHYKKVTWGGNANMWITNARAQGYTIGKTPKPGSILQLTGRGYNPRYGHVAIVMEVHGKTMTIMDMNYSGLNVVTERKMSIYHPAIDGYIYGVE